MNGKEKGKKGFVFSMDTAYAILIILLASAVIMAMISIPQEKTGDQLHLSRIARDIHEVNQSMDGNLNVQEIENQYSGIKINDCSGEEIIASHEAVVYDNEGELKIITTEVCPQ